MAEPTDKPPQKEHVVVPGDRMSSIAHEHGYKDYKLLYLAQSDDFKKLRPNPEILMPGDKVTLPDKIDEKHPAKDKKQHKYEEDTTLPEVRIVLRVAGQPFANKTVIAWGCKGPEWAKLPTLVTTDKTGMALFRILPELDEITLSSTDPIFEVKLRVGDLRPVTAPGGVEQRVDNLGYRVPVAPASAPAGSEAEKKAREAQERSIKNVVARFQERMKKAPDGKVGDPLRKLLADAHKS